MMSNNLVREVKNKLRRLADGCCILHTRIYPARAVTGRKCPHSEKGKDFLTGQPDFFTETAVTPERKVKKSFPRWEINRHAEG